MIGDLALKWTSLGIIGKLEILIANTMQLKDARIYGVTVEEIEL